MKLSFFESPILSFSNQLMLRPVIFAINSNQSSVIVNSFIIVS